MEAFIGTLFMSIMFVKFFWDLQNWIIKKVTRKK